MYYINLPDEAMNIYFTMKIYLLIITLIKTKNRQRRNKALSGVII
jgi:hypothetical protein